MERKITITDRYAIRQGYTCADILFGTKLIEVNKNVEKYKRNTDRIKDKSGQADYRQLDYDLLNDRIRDLISCAKLDYQFGKFFNYDVI